MFSFMRTPRVSILIIIGQFILLLACLGFLALALWHNYFLKVRAKEFAAEAGFAMATSNFSHGNFYLYEVKLYKFNADDSGIVPTDGTTEASGRRNGQFQIYYFLVDQDWPKMHQEIQQAYVDAYNQRMRQFFEHPEWFDKNGQRIPMHELQKQTTNLAK
jgi:hypothetical protein